MRIISKKAIVEFCRVNRRKDAPAAKTAMLAWHAEAKAAKWLKSADIKARYGSADILTADRAVFDICGNNYRIVARIKYGPKGIVWIRFVGTHAQYDKINAREV